MSAPLAMGVRRRCLSCGSAFYDMGRTPIVCPKCGVEFTVVEYARRAEPARRYAPAPVSKPVEEPGLLEADGDEAATLDRDEDEEETSGEDETDELLTHEDEADAERG